MKLSRLVEAGGGIGEGGVSHRSSGSGVGCGGQYKRSAAGEATPGTDMAGGQTGWACGRRARLLGRPRD